MFGAIGGFITFIIIAVIILFVLSTCCLLYTSDAADE